MKPQCSVTEKEVTIADNIEHPHNKDYSYPEEWADIHSFSIEEEHRSIIFSVNCDKVLRKKLKEFEHEPFLTSDGLYSKIEFLHVPANGDPIWDKDWIFVYGLTTGRRRKSFFKIDYNLLEQYFIQNSDTLKDAKPGLDLDKTETLETVARLDTGKTETLARLLIDVNNYIERSANF